MDLWGFLKPPVFSSDESERYSWQASAVARSARAARSVALWLRVWSELWSSDNSVCWCVPWWYENRWFHSCPFVGGVGEVVHERR